MKTKNLPVQLKEEEIKVKGEELAKTIDAHTKLEDEKKKITADFSKRLKESSADIRRLAKVVETGKENREVIVNHEYYPKEGVCKIFREDTGDLVETRAMTGEEYQLEFFSDEDVILEESER